MSTPERTPREAAQTSPDVRDTAAPRSGSAVEPSRGTPATGPVGGRVEVGDAQSSDRDRPSIESGLENAPIQHEREDDAPVLPANASGHDKVSADELAQPIDDESMYDNRPSQDKDRPPSENAR